MEKYIWFYLLINFMTAICSENLRDVEYDDFQENRNFVRPPAKFTTEIINFDTLDQSSVKQSDTSYNVSQLLVNTFTTICKEAESFIIDSSAKTFNTDSNQISLEQKVASQRKTKRFTDKAVSYIKKYRKDTFNINEYKEIYAYKCKEKNKSLKTFLCNILEDDTYKTITHFIFATFPKTSNTIIFKTRCSIDQKILEIMEEFDFKNKNDLEKIGKKAGKLKDVIKKAVEKKNKKSQRYT